MYTDITKLEKDLRANGQARQEFMLVHNHANTATYDTTAQVISSSGSMRQSTSNAIQAMPYPHGIHYAPQHREAESQSNYANIRQCVAQVVAQPQLPHVLLNHDSFEFFKALVEWEFSQMTNDERDKFAEACNFDDYRWQRPSSIVAFVATVFNISLVQSTLTLAKYFGICPENMFSVFPQSANTEKAIKNRNGWRKTVTEHVPDELSIGGELYGLAQRDYQYDYGGEVEQVIYTYTKHDRASFSVIASRYMNGDQPTIKIGHNPTVAKFLSSAHIDRVNRPTVMICTDLETSLSLRKLARETKLYDNCTIIISGYFGGTKAISSLNYSVLFGAHVIIVPAPTRDGLNEAKDLLMKCTTAGASNTKIFLGIVAFADTVLPEVKNTHSSWLQDFYSKPVAINHETPLSLVATYICNTAVDNDAYQKWQIEHALAAPEATNTSAAIPTLRISPLDSITEVARDTSVPITTDDLFSPFYTNLIWGPSNIGKTWVIVEICICIMLGLPTFFLARPISVRKEHIITIVDGENEDGLLKQRFTQLFESKGYSEDALDRQILIAKLEPGKNLSDTAEQENLLTSLKATGTTLLVIDNLLSLMPDATTGQSKKLFDFLAKIKDMGIIVIVVHHAGKTGNTYLGSSNLESLSQNIIELSRLEEEEIEAYQSNDGAFYLKMQVTKCKVPGNTFANKSAIYTLPLGGGWQRLEGNLPYYDAGPSDAMVDDIYPSDVQSTESSELIQRQDEALPQMHPSEMKLFQFMKSRDSFTKADIQSRLGVSEATARNKINNFIKLDLIVKHGGKGNKNTYYTVK